MEIIITELKAHILDNQHKGCHPDGQAYDIDQGGDTISEQVTKGYKEVVFKHGEYFLILIYHSCHYLIDEAILFLLQSI